MYEYRKHKENCVDINIYVECDKKEDKKEHYEEDHSHKKHKNHYSCVDVNVYAECDKCKHKKNKHFDRHNEKY